MQFLDNPTYADEAQQPELFQWKELYKKQQKGDKLRLNSGITTIENIQKHAQQKPIDHDNKTIQQ